MADGARGKVRRGSGCLIHMARPTAGVAKWLRQGGLWCRHTWGSNPTSLALIGLQHAKFGWLRSFFTDRRRSVRFRVSWSAAWLWASAYAEAAPVFSATARTSILRETGRWAGSGSARWPAASIVAISCG